MSAWKTSRQALYKKRKPWVRFVEWARRRCNDLDPEGPNYWTYAAKGIICKLTAADLEAVWKANNAHLLKRPSLDRIEPDGHYTRDNVRFIEFNLNVRMPHNKALADEVTPEFT